MDGVPAFCPHCGTIFIARNLIGGSGAMTVHFQGSQTNCPNCGKWANIVDGQFLLSNETMTFESGPPLSRAIVERLMGIAKRARNAEITPAQAVKEAALIDPELGSFFAKFVVYGLPILLAILSCWLEYDGNVSSSEVEAAVLKEMQAQTALMQQLNEKVGSDHKQERAAPPKPQAKPKVAAPVPKSTRRAEVNRTRRDALKVRRSQFGASNNPK